MSDGFSTQVISSGSVAGQWRRRASFYSSPDRKETNAKVSKHLTILVVINVVVYLASWFLPFTSTSVSFAVLAASVGYFLKDTELLLSPRSSNNSFVSEILIAILRRLLTPAGFQEALRKGLACIRAGEDFQPTSIEWPSDLVIQKMDRLKVETILKSLVLHPKTRDLDPFVCSLGMALAQRDPSFYDDIPLVNPIFKEEDFMFPTKAVLDINVPLGYLCSERGPTTWIGRLIFKVTSHVSLWMMDTLELFEETKDPLHFESIEEAAVFFHYIIRPHIPRSTRRIAYISETKDVEGNACAHAFAGVGSWRLKAVRGERKAAVWAKREASATCIPPKGSVAVIDCSWQAAMEVRQGYVPYGAAAFFGKDKELLGIWNESEKRMTLPCAVDDDEDDEPWRWAQYHWKTSIAYEVFGVGHLLEIHWSASNTLVQVARDLRFDHPIRRLIKPFTWGSAFINFKAMINLVQTSGGIVRIGAVSIDGIAKHFDHIMEEHVHYGSFDKFVDNMGEFPEGFIEEVPMVEDGKKLWAIFERFVEDYMNVFYEDREASEDGLGDRVEDDPELQIFWEHARTARSKKYPLKLGKLSFENLKELLTWGFFWSCATHNLMASFFSENTLPTSFAGRIESSVRSNSPESGFQVPIYTWLTQTIVLALTTLDCVPFLIEAIRDTADFFGPNNLAVYKPNDQARMAFVGFADRMDELSEEIDTRNESRGWLATNCFNPKVMRCSASL